MKKILVPLELRHPEEEKRTVLYGARMALDLRMELNLTHSLSDSQYAFGWSAAEGYPRYNPGKLIEEQEEFVHNKLHSYEKEIHEVLDPAPNVNIHILRNIYAEQLSGKTEWNDVDFVVLCRENVLNRSLIPVRNTDPKSMEYDHLPAIIHPPLKDYKPVRKILYCTNYNPYDMEVLKKLANLFNPLTNEITVLYITEVLDLDRKLKIAGYSKMVRSEIRNKNIKVITELTRRNSDISDLLRSFAVDRESDLIVVLKEEKNLLERLVQPSVIDKLAIESELPLMVFFESGKVR